MYTLQVEELEPRQLLSGAGGSVRPALAPSAAASTCAAPKTPQSAPVDSGSAHASSSAPDTPRQSTEQHTAISANTHPSVASSGQQTVAPSAGNAAPAESVASSRASPVVPVTTFTASNVSVSPEPASPSHAPGPDGSAEAAAVSGEPTPAATETLAAASSEHPNPQFPAGAGNLTAIPVLHAEVQAQAVTRAIVAAVREGEGPGTWSFPWLDNHPLVTPGTSPSPMGEVPGEEAPAAELVLPSLPAPDVLSALWPWGLSTVERGMEQFLQQLDRMGQRLGRHHDDQGLWPWLVAGAAAATACEIARRQLRRTAPLPILDTRGELTSASANLPEG